MQIIPRFSMKVQGQTSQIMDFWKTIVLKRIMYLFKKKLTKIDVKRGGVSSYVPGARDVFDHVFPYPDILLIQ